MDKRRTFLKAAAIAGIALAAPALVRKAAARTTTITIASLLGDDKPETKIWLKIGELVEAKLPGQFKFNIVKSGALGGEKEVAEGVRLGSIHASLSTVSSLSGWVPELQILDLPFLFRDADHVRRTVSGDIGADLKGKLQAQNFVVGDFINYGARHLLTKEPVTRPEQLKGKRIRVIQSPLHSKLWSAFGMTPIGIPITETYNSLATGVADAMDLTKSAYAGFKLYEVVPYMTETGHIWASGIIYYSSTFWNGLNGEQKAVLQQASAEGAAYFNQLIVDDEAASVEISLKNGGKLLKPEAFEAWQRGAQGVWDDFAPIVGGLDRIKAIQSA
ncbi:tripartite ATP-independent transporter DctP family solute receptor [Rhizobium sp. BK650]|uniref:TRAP transporter substrate-binding protein n=1 Tax=Rhizobium sp. BK650 TaxID=2586990 RepID=UPI0016198A7A|nr:TRAP transporter substrate-binding protein [Rhizobium sp. BK650]MBB3657801.1 tripartite ATP-independent transporter DctP family solute receptor [Rhizobium sp. BK650]